MKITFTSKADRAKRKEIEKEKKKKEEDERRKRRKLKNKQRLSSNYNYNNGSSSNNNNNNNNNKINHNNNTIKNNHNNNRNNNTIKNNNHKKKKKKKNFFDWDDTEDTTLEDSYYDEICHAKVMFGRGKFAGEMGVDEMKATVHWSKKKLNDMVPRDWRALKEEFQIHTHGKNISNPLRGWADINLPEKLMKGINMARYDIPTPIQRQCVPLGLDGRDMMGIAATGSGKTAAFLIPLLVSVLAQPIDVLNRCVEDGPLALILAPTRELVQQINSECEKLAKFTLVSTMSIVGGQSVDQQASRIREGVHLIAATPGRLVDLIESSYLVLQQCQFLVLDEADRMIDMGFEPAVIQILDSMVAPGKKTTHMFSATMPPIIERLSKKYLNDPVKVRVGDRSQMNIRITQDLVIVSNQIAKAKQLGKVLRRTNGPIMVFVNTKISADKLGDVILKFGYRAVVLHGGKEQSQRERALNDFRTGRANVLVATDVAGRGIDIPDVQHVINYDMPSEIERYTHRIGRTGRAGKDGLATTILGKDVDGKYIVDLKNSFKKTNNRWKKDWDDAFGIVQQKNVQ